MVYSQADLKVPVTRALWDGTGFISGRTFDVPLFSPSFNDIVQVSTEPIRVIALLTLRRPTIEEMP